MFRLKTLSRPATAIPANFATPVAALAAVATSANGRAGRPVAELATVAVADAANVSSLSPVQEAARGDVLRWLEGHPTVRRAFATRVGDDVLIVTLALRSVGTCELSIPLDRFDRENLEDWAALFSCLDPDDSLRNSERAVNGESQR
jgi:hypothetical protein